MDELFIFFIRSTGILCREFIQRFYVSTNHSACGYLQVLLGFLTIRKESMYYIVHENN